MNGCKYGSWNCIHNTSFSSKLKNGPNKQEYLITLGRKGLPVTNTLVYCAHLLAMKKMKGCKYGTWNCIHNTSFSLKLTNGPNKREHLITPGRKGLPVTNTLVYCAHL
jgi:spore coat protein U-like protein